MSSAPGRADGFRLFLAERYLPDASEQTARADAKLARATRERLAREGTDVNYLGSALVPADQMCFALFEAHSAEHVEQLIARAQIPYDHIVEAVRLSEDANDMTTPADAAALNLAAEPSRGPSGTPRSSFPPLAPPP